MSKIEDSKDRFLQGVLDTTGIVASTMGPFGGKWKLEVDAGYLRSKRREVATQQVLMGLSGEDIVAREMKYHKRLLRKTFYGKDK